MAPIGEFDFIALVTYLGRVPACCNYSLRLVMLSEIFDHTQPKAAVCSGDQYRFHPFTPSNVVKKILTLDRKLSDRLVARRCLCHNQNNVKMTILHNIVRVNNFFKPLKWTENILLFGRRTLTSSKQIYVIIQP